MTRDAEFERLFFAAVDYEAADHRVDATAFLERAAERLRVGAERYGDDAYLKRPDGENYRELLEEPPDIPVWAVLHLQRLMHDEGEVSPWRWRCLVRAAAFAAMADLEIRKSEAELE